MDDLIALLSDPRLYIAIVTLVSLIAGAMPSVGGERFVVLKRLLGAVRTGLQKAKLLVCIGCVAGALGWPAESSALELSDLIRDDSLDLRVLKLGRTIAADFAFAGVGVRLFPVERLPRTVIDAQPLYLDPALGSCKLWGGLPWCGLVGQAPPESAG